MDGSCHLCGCDFDDLDQGCDQCNNLKGVPGDRFEIHPAHYLWMIGARYGTIIRRREGSRKYTVQMDKVKREFSLHFQDVFRLIKE